MSRSEYTSISAAASGQLIKRYRGSRTSFARTYTSADVLLLAHTDSLHGTLSGLATKKLMERAFELFKEVGYCRKGIFLACLDLRGVGAEYRPAGGIMVMPT